MYIMYNIHILYIIHHVTKDYTSLQLTVRKSDLTNQQNEPCQGFTNDPFKAVTLI